MSVHVVTIQMDSNVNVSLSQIAKKNMLEALRATGGPLEGMFGGLFSNETQVDPDTILDNFTVPAWTGYANQAITSNPATEAGQFGATIECVSVDWEPGSDADVTIQGAFIADSGGNFAVGFGYFDEPLIVAGETTITVVFVFLWT